MLALEAHPYAMEFRDATTKEWRLPSSNKFSAPLSNLDGNEETAGRVVGEVRAAHGDSKHGAGEYVFVSVHEAG